MPPALPIALVVGTSTAVAKLRLRRIFCISPNRVNFAGRVELMCFDKTGTITQEGLDLQSVCYTSQQALGYNGTRAEVMKEHLSAEVEGSLGRTFYYAMATCHGLSFAHSEIVGDPLEVKIFNATEFVCKYVVYTSR